MNEFRIVGNLRPNLVKLQNIVTKTIVTLPVNTIRKLIDADAIKVVNAELIYPRI